MKNSKRTLLKTVTDRAEASFGQRVTRDNFAEWYRHWITAGDAFVTELEREGLYISARHVKGHVDYFRRRYHVYVTPPPGDVSAGQPSPALAQGGST